MNNTDAFDRRRDFVLQMNNTIVGSVGALLALLAFLALLAPFSVTDF
jgi:hypothetical protein